MVLLYASDYDSDYDSVASENQPSERALCFSYVIITLHCKKKVIRPAPVVQRLDNAIHRINHYPADSVVCFVNTYPLDSDLSGG